MVSWELLIQDVEVAERTGVDVDKMLSRRVSGSESRTSGGGGLAA